MQKEGSVCWYDGLSCKLNSLMLSKVQFLFFLKVYIIASQLSSEACNNKMRVGVMVTRLAHVQKIGVQLLYPHKI